MGRDPFITRAKHFLNFCKIVGNVTASWLVVYPGPPPKTIKLGIKRHRGADECRDMMRAIIKAGLLHFGSPVIDRENRFIFRLSKHVSYRTAKKLIGGRRNNEILRAAASGIVGFGIGGLLGLSRSRALKTRIRVRDGLGISDTGGMDTALSVTSSASNNQRRSRSNLTNLIPLPKHFELKYRQNNADPWTNALTEEMCCSFAKLVQYYNESYYVNADANENFEILNRDPNDENRMDSTYMAFLTSMYLSCGYYDRRVDVTAFYKMLFNCNPDIQRVQTKDSREEDRQVQKVNLELSLDSSGTIYSQIIPIFRMQARNSIVEQWSDPSLEQCIELCKMIVIVGKKAYIAELDDKLRRLTGPKQDIDPLIASFLLTKQIQTSLYSSCSCNRGQSFEDFVGRLPELRLLSAELNLKADPDGSVSLSDLSPDYESDLEYESSDDVSTARRIYNQQKQGLELDD